MKVKSIKEVLVLLEKAGYIMFSDSFQKENLPKFTFEMFEYCSDKPNDIYFIWMDEWLEEEPCDVVGKLCSVWDDGPEPKNNLRIFGYILDYKEAEVYPFKAETNEWMNARLITDKDLVL